MRILSGVFPDEAAFRSRPARRSRSLIENEDQRSKDYSEIKDKFRPGHADYTYLAKYGIRDYRGGGRSSARETAMRVAAGAVARKVLPGVNNPVARSFKSGPQKIDRAKWDWDEVDRNPFFCPDASAVQGWTAYLDEVRKTGSSCGAIDGDCGRRRGRRPRRAALRQARPGHRCRIDEHKRGEGR